jgi:hypothetical protein
MLPEDAYNYVEHNQYEIKDVLVDANIYILGLLKKEIIVDHGK